MSLSVDHEPARRLEAEAVSYLAVRTPLLKPGDRPPHSVRAAGYSELSRESGYLTMTVPSMRGWTVHMYL
jgi:hypothetical protein